MPKKLDRFNIVLMADTHAGSKLALRNPDWIIQRKVIVQNEDDLSEWWYELEYYNPPMEPVQEFLWEKYKSWCEEFIQIADDDPIFLIHLGETCEGTYFKNSSMRLKKDEQVQIAIANMSPWLDLPNLKLVRILSGDRPHEFDEGAAGRMVVDGLKKVLPDVKGVEHGLLDIGGFTIDYKHRGAFPGSRKWLEGNVAFLDAKDHIIRELVEYERKPADLIASAHYHEPIEVRTALRYKMGMLRTALLIVPSMKFPSEHAKNKAMKQRSAATVGMTMVEVVNNKILDFHHRYAMVDTRTREVYDGK